MRVLRASEAVVERERIGSFVVDVVLPTVAPVLVETVVVLVVAAVLGCCWEGVLEARMVESEVAKGTGLLRFLRGLAGLLLLLEFKGAVRYVEEPEDSVSGSGSEEG